MVNFMSVTATNANLDLIYYEMSPVAILQKNENVAEALRKFDEEKKRVTITIDRLEPGRAKVVEIRIPEYKPEQLGYIEVGISFDGISFLGSTK